LMNGSTPFRNPELVDTVFGRSWAIHDRIIDEIPEDDILEGEWSSPEMYIMIEKPRGSITFPEPKIR